MLSFVLKLNFTQKIIILLLFIIIIVIVFKRINKLLDILKQIVKSKLLKILKVKQTKVKYKRDTYDVSLFARFKIEKYKIILKTKKIYHLFKRLLNYAKPLIIVLICLFLYALIVLIYGKNFIDTNYSVNNLLWDIKSEIFTLIFLTYFVNATTRENERHKKLIERHDFYVETMYSFCDTITEICNYIGKLNFDSNPLYTNTKYLKLVDEILNLEDDKQSQTLYFTNIDKISQLVKLMKTFLRETEKRTRNLRLYDIDDEMLFYEIQSIIDKQNTLERIIIREENTYSQFIREFAYFVRNCGGLIDYIREPWRRDFYIDKKIYKLLYNEKPEYIVQDYYYSMLMDI